MIYRSPREAPRIQVGKISNLRDKPLINSAITYYTFRNGIKRIFSESATNSIRILDNTNHDVLIGNDIPWNKNDKNEYSTYRNRKTKKWKTFVFLFPIFEEWRKRAHYQRTNKNIYSHKKQQYQLKWNYEMQRLLKQANK